MDFSLIFCGFLCMVVVGVLLPWWCLWLWWQRWVSFVWIFAVGWWRGHGFQFGSIVCGGGGNRWLQIWDFVFIWVLIYIILLCKYIILMSRIEK